jgi:type I restriction enzyme S subunit
MSTSDAKVLPNGWAIADLGQVGTLLCGQSPPSSTVNTDGRGTIYISGPEHWDGIKVHVNKWTTAPAKMVPEGTIFVTVKGAGVGTVFPGVAGAIGRDIYAFLPEQKVPRDFVTHALRFTIAEVIKKAQGDIPGLSKDHILNHKIPLPPSAEQSRISDVIDELFTDLDAGAEALRKVSRNLARYRAAVLKAAVDGTLTEDWRRQHVGTEPASVLLARILAERRRRWEQDQIEKFVAAGKSLPTNWRAKYKEPLPPDVTDLPPLPAEWTWASLDQIADIAGGVTKGQKFLPSEETRMVPYLRVANVQRGFLDLTKIKEIRATENDIRALRLQPGDVLFNEGGDRDKLGRGWIWEGQIAECIHQNHVFRARLFTQEIQPKIVSWSGNSYGQRWFMRTGKQSVNLASINMTVLRSFPVPLVPAAEQEAVVEAVEDQFSLIEHIELNIGTRLQSAHALRQSILHHAFSGQMLPQDPNDEPASDLLERIVADRQARAREMIPAKRIPKHRNGAKRRVLVRTR